MSLPASQCTDCAVIGGGPGGLTAAIYLARFNRQVVVFDQGKPRVDWSPRNHNYPGFPDGLSGREILEKFEEQAEAFHVEPRSERVLALRKLDDGFEVETKGGALQARRIILATGIRDHWPKVPGAEKLLGRQIRVCPICDAYETNGKRIAILGGGDRVAREALYLVRFTCRVVLFTLCEEGSDSMSEEMRRRLEEAGVAVLTQRLVRMDGTPSGGVCVTLDDGCKEEFDLIFSALGVTPNSQLAADLGAALDEQGYIITDRWQESTVPGLYAVGDVTFEINQVTVAVGQAAVAATAVHNGLLDF